ncbi:MAG: HAD family hydrolase [Thermodesulfobacteriota bacterium]|nr:HAD family hydrolase [Thermodesulfobacteriota bacterium]
MDVSEKRDELRGIRAVIFDFDGTLAVLNIDFPLMRERIISLIRHFGIEERAIRERYLLEIIDEVYPMIREKDSSGAEEFYDRAHQILHEVELKAAEEGSLIPGVGGTLRTLRLWGIKVGIVTRNCEEAVRKVFPDIDDYCDAFISRDSVDKVKPHPDHLNSVLGALKVSGEEAVMVGDHIIDIQAGKKVGTKTVGVLTGRINREEFEKAGADYILRDVSEIYPLLKEGI